MKLTIALALLASFCVPVLGAEKPPTAVKAPPAVKETVSAAEISALYTEIGGSMTLQKTLENGDIAMSGKIAGVPVNVLLEACKTNRCSLMLTFVVVDDSAATLNFLNSFNGTVPLGRVARLSDNGVAIFELTSLLGGVTHSHLSYETAAVLALLQRYANERAKAPKGASANLVAPDVPMAGFADTAPNHADLAQTLALAEPAAADWLTAVPKVNLTPAAQ